MPRATGEKHVLAFDDAQGQDDNFVRPDDWDLTTGSNS
jgi:hypothetical protein